MRVKVEDLQLQPGRRREAVDHPGELRTADQGTELPFLRFYLHQCCPAFEGMARPSRQQRCNGGKPVATPRAPSEFGLYSSRGAAKRPILGPVLAIHRYTGPVLSTRLLTKRYGSLTAVEDLDLEVGAGEL